MIDQFTESIAKYLTSVHMPSIRITDVVEILIITFVVYHIIIWVKKTKAWSLVKGFVFILGFLFFAALLNMTTILWIAEKCFSIFAIAVVVVLQPELRKAMDHLGKKNFFASLISPEIGKDGGRFSDRTIDEIVKAAFAMGRDKTGALMVFERYDNLNEYERTGIELDAMISSQLIINMFEHNTPLHDGAAIFRNDRITSATCYLPLSENQSLSKALGTRHRAGVGISEVTDSLTIIVSEENGKVSVAYEGELYSGLNQEGLREKLLLIQDKPDEEVKKSWLGITRDSKKEKRKKNEK